MNTLSQIIAGVKFKNPIIVSSGPLTRKANLLKLADDHGAAAVSIKHIMTDQPFEGKSRWYFQPETKTLGVVSEPRLDLEDGENLIKWARKETGLVILANMSGPQGAIERWGETAEKLEKAGAHFLELNMTCPNLDAPSQIESASKDVKRVALGAMIGRDPVLAAAVTRCVKDAVKIPVICKLTSVGGAMVEVAKACGKAGADAVSMAAGIPGAPHLDIYDGGKPKVAGIEGKISFGGLGGPWTRLISNRLIADLRKEVQIPVMGAGGIWTWQDIVESIMYGSLLIQTCRSLMYKGFRLVDDWLKGMQSFMEEAGYADIPSFSGIALKNFCAPKDLEIVPVNAQVNQDECTGCKKCLDIGHCDAIVLVDKKAQVNNTLCVGCSMCTIICPVSAITMSADSQ
jgi:dihydroorotate dehydrogenase subfamily 1